MHVYIGRLQQKIGKFEHTVQVLAQHEVKVAQIAGELQPSWAGDSGCAVQKALAVLLVEFPDDVDLGDFEIVEDGQPYREWCTPAELSNAYATVRLMTEDELGVRVATAFQGARPAPA
jgi:hypothetical protein